MRIIEKLEVPIHENSKTLCVYGMIIGLLSFACSPSSNENNTAPQPTISVSTTSPLTTTTVHKWTPSDGLGTLPVEQVGSISSEELRAIPLNLIPLIPINKLRALSREQFLSLTNDQFSALTVPQFLSRDPVDYHRMTGEQFSALTPEHIQVFTYSHLNLVKNEHILWLRNEQIEALRKLRLNAMGSVLWTFDAQTTPLLRLENLKLVLLIHLTGHGGVTERFLSYLTPDQIRNLPVEYFASSFTHSAIQLLNQEQSDAITADQILALNDENREFVLEGKPILILGGPCLPPQSSPDPILLQSSFYRGSEAERLNQSLHIQLFENRFSNGVLINNQFTDISDFYPPRIAHAGLTDEEFSEFSEFLESIALSETQIQGLDSDIQNRIVDVVSNHSILQVNEVDEPQPNYNLREVSSAEQSQINSIRERISIAVSRLNQMDRSGYYVSSDFYDHPCLFRNRIHLRSFLSMMNAIETNNEESFIHSLLHLATAFRQYRINAKLEFIEAFTHLYVTKEFPSREISQSYFYLIVHCGELF
jgi:hypothetical protein